MSVENPTDGQIANILTQTKTIAVVGASSNPARPSHEVMGFLMTKGFDVFPINPAAVGETIHGCPVLADLSDVPVPIDMVDIFRRSDVVAPIVDQAIALEAKTIWMQLGVVDEQAAETARRQGLAVVMDRCPVIEWARLGLE